MPLMMMMMRQQQGHSRRPEWHYRGPTLEAGARRQTHGGRVFANGTGLGTARNSDVGPPSSRFTTRRRVQWGRVQCDLGGSRGWGP